MPDEQTAFPLLPLPFVLRDTANPDQGRDRLSRTDENKNDRAGHGSRLESEIEATLTDIKDKRARRSAPSNATLPAGTSLLMQVDEYEDIDFLRAAFGFEVVSEEENGFVIVTTEQDDLAGLLAKVRQFALEERGSGQVAKLYRLAPDAERLQHVLSDTLQLRWPTIPNNEILVIDVAISCDGGLKYPEKPKKEEEEGEDHYAARLKKYEDARQSYYLRNDAVQIEREQQLIDIVAAYAGKIHEISQVVSEHPARFADSFTARISISGNGFRDLAQNFPHVFEIAEPDDFLAIDPVVQDRLLDNDLVLHPPDKDAPTVCVIDSGIQEGHRLVAPAILTEDSICLLPGVASTDVADYVRPGGHGTSVAGAILFKDNLPNSGEITAPFWIQNVRVLNEHCRVPVELFPPKYIRLAVERLITCDQRTRLYNHSICAIAPHRKRHMSAWASEIDHLSYKYDILVIQSAGNLYQSGTSTMPGILDHIEAGRYYPDYLMSEASRIPNPAQSLQALTVGSISYDEFNLLGERTFACKDGPSAFSRTGLGIWSSIKPEVVEYGGDYYYNIADPVRLLLREENCPNLVRSTLDGGPERGRDRVGTSFSAPKVSHLAAKLQALLPNEPTLLYRALIVNSARWPIWAETAKDKLSVVRHIGYGLPSEERATTNSPYRVTMTTNGVQFVKAKEAHLYQVPIPECLRAVDRDFDIRIDVTLSYAARPRRTRRQKHYLSTWLSWKASGKNEDDASFRKLIFKNNEDERGSRRTGFGWTIQERSDWGDVHETNRTLGTVQKDWATIKPFELPEVMCIAVVGHVGWDRHPEAVAKYSLVVSFDVLGQEVEIFEEIRARVEQVIEATI
jgi:hypothetical protein